MLKVITIDEILKVGSTKPLRVTCSDSNQYILKGINKYVETGKVLFNEIVSSRFAKLMGLDTPNAFIGVLSSDVIKKAESALFDFKDCGFASGKCFLSEYIEGTSLKVNSVNAKYISNIDIIPKLIVFDTMLMNSDRNENGGNWYHVKKSQKLIAIDHSNIFRIAQIWDKNSLKQDETNPPKIIESIREGNDYKILIDEYKKRVYKKGEHKGLHQHPFSVIERKIKQLPKLDVDNCCAGIPKAWGVSFEDQEAAKEFLRFQIDHIDDIIQELEQLFKV